MLTCLRLEGESETNEADPEALSLLLHYSLFCREWISLEDHQQSLQQLVKRIHANQSPEDKGIDISVRLFKLSPETRVFRLPSTTLFSNLTRSIQPEAIENRSIALLKSQTIGSDNDLKAYKSLRKVTVKALRATDLVGIDLLGLSFTTPNVYIVLSTGISVIRTPVRLSTLNPSWEEASFEMEYWSTWALREDIYLSFSLYYTSRFGLSADLHYGTAKIPLQITDDISGSFEARSVLISPSNLGAIRNSVAIARKKSAPAAMLHALIVLSDI